MTNSIFYTVTGFFANLVGKVAGLPLVIPSPLALIGFLMNPNDVGAGSDQLPLIVTSSDGSAYKDLRDPTATWRNISDRLPVSAQRQADLTVDWNQRLQDLRDDIDRVTIPKPLPIPAIDPTCNKDFNAALNWRRPGDPLILDLDGDGIELTASNSAVLFDHNADNIKTGTQWARADDGILVRDINGNGLIDSGRELFGDQTMLTSGPYAGTLASTGFRALKDLDNDASGVADSNFDASDVAYTSLKLWRDLNQDGISQANELQSLSQAGIVSIKIATYPQGQSSFNQTVPGVDASGAAVTAHVARAIRDVKLGQNNFYREFTDDPVVTAAAAALPQISGAGFVRDMREAMSLGTPQAAALQSSVQAFEAATTMLERQSLLANVVTTWGATSSTAQATCRNPASSSPPTYSDRRDADAIAPFAASQPAMYGMITSLEHLNGQVIAERYMRGTERSYRSGCYFDSRHIGKNKCHKYSKFLSNEDSESHS